MKGSSWITLLFTVCPLSALAEQVKPFDAYCEQPEIIISGVTPRQAMDGLKKRMQSTGAVRIATDELLVIDSALLNPEIQHHPDGDDTFTQSRWQFSVDESRTGVRLRGWHGLLGYSSAEPTLTIDDTRPEAELVHSVLTELARQLGGPELPRAVTPADFDTVAKAALAQFEEGRTPFVYRFEAAPDGRVRAAVSKLRPVDQAQPNTLPVDSLPSGHALIREFNVRPDEATVIALLGPNDEKMQCGEQMTVRFESKRSGWSVCERIRTVC